MPLFWGITADGCVAFSDDIDMLKGSCGKSLAPFPQGINARDLIKQLSDHALICVLPSTKSLKMLLANKLLNAV